MLFFYCEENVQKEGNMKKIFMGMPVVGSVLALMLIAPSVSANLIVNGDFEQDMSGATPVQSWGAYKHLYADGDVDAWYNGQDGSHIELWSNKDNTNTFAELNSHKSNDTWDLTQQVYRDAGEQYILSFDYKARRDDGEVFSFMLNNTETSDWNVVTGHTTSEWSHWEQVFTADVSDYSYLIFNATNGGDTYGNFIDNVSLTRVVAPADIPEPSMFALLGLCLAGFCFSKKKKLINI